MNRRSAHLGGGIPVCLSSQALAIVAFIVCLAAKAGASIAIVPASQALRAGETARFSITTEGQPFLHYQWRFNGIELINATNAELTLSNVQPAQAGVYSVVACTDVGVSATNYASLEVCWEVEPLSFDQRSDVPYGWPLKFDATGNLYLGNHVAGEHGFSLLKFDPDHELAWEIRPVPERQLAILWLGDFTVDSEGNVYVVGGSETNYHSQVKDVVIWKFNREGTQVWFRSHESRGIARGVAVDDAGHFFVVGTTSESPPGDVELIKFSPNGQRLWTVIRRRDVDGESPGALAVDGNGNLYFGLTAFRSGTIPSSELMVIKYDSEGTEQWIARYQRSNLYPPDSILVDQNSNIVVGVSSWRGAPFDNHFTIKFDANGNLLWAKQHFEHSDSGGKGARALDVSGNIYFGIAEDGERKFILTKYDPEGRQLWRYDNASLDGESSYWGGAALRVGPDHELVLAGYVGDWSVPPSLSFLHLLQNAVAGRPTIHGSPLQFNRVASGTTVQFAVTASGLAPLNYQWRLDGMEIANATNATLVFTNVTTASSGSYSVLVENSVGCALSPDSQLMVVDVPPFRFDQVVVSSNRISLNLTDTEWFYWIETSTNLIDWVPLFGYGGGPTTISKPDERQVFIRARTFP